MSEETPGVQELFDQNAGCLPLAVEFNGRAARFVGVEYANEGDLISGEGAGRYGGRWNPRGIKVIYASLEDETALKESRHEFPKYGFEDEDVEPRVMAWVRIRIHCLLDLTDASVRRRIGFRLDELIEEDWEAIQRDGDESWTQAIGRGCHVAGFEGLIAPSARNRRGRVIVVFPGKLRPESYVDLMAKEKLPPHPSKWSK